jgi:hypothetical protein
MKSFSGKVFIIEVDFYTARFASLISFLTLPFKLGILVSIESSEGSDKIFLLLERRNPQFSLAIASYVINFLVSLLQVSMKEAGREGKESGSTFNAMAGGRWLDRGRMLDLWRWLDRGRWIEIDS